MKKEFELTSWTLEGFSAAPEEKPVRGGETIYRAFGGCSKPLGNCFFVPAVGSTPLNHWTAELLETELNASLWGNDFDGVTKYAMQKVDGAKYKVGPIAHDGYAGVDAGQLFYQRSWITPSGIFKQVVFILNAGLSLSTLVRAESTFAIAPGRYHRRSPRLVV